jgi:hypothetical protein
MGAIELDYRNNGLEVQSEWSSQAVVDIAYDWG